MSQPKWERRDNKKRGAWYKRYLANNRKALEVIIQAQRDRMGRINSDGNAISGKS